MNKKFNERDFLKVVKNFTDAIKFWNSDNTATSFLNEIVLHMNYSFDEVREYIGELHWVLGKRVEMKTGGDWKDLYKYIIDNSRDSNFATMLQCGHKFFKSADRLATYYNLMAEEVNMNPEIWKTRYFLHKIGGKEVVNTLCYVVENGITLEGLRLSSEEVKDVVSVECSEISDSEENLIDLTTEEPAKDIEKKPIQSEIEIEMDMTTPTVDYEMDSTATMALPEPVVPENKKKTSTGKRGYNQPIAAYKPVADFCSLEEAEKSTGVLQGEIKRCIEGEIQTAGGFVWRWTGKKKDRLSQFEHAATYNNMLDAEKSTGVNHSNISAVLKGRGNTTGGLVWIRVNGEKVSSDKSATSMEIAHKKEREGIKTVSSSDKVLVAYHLTKLEELDITKGPIGIFKTQNEATKELKIDKGSLSNYLAGRKRKLRWTKNESEKYWIGIRWESTFPPSNNDTDEKKKSRIMKSENVISGISHQNNSSSNFIRVFSECTDKCNINPSNGYNHTNAQSNLKPIVTWPGGKANELKYIYPALPSYNRFFEPFVGGGSVFMGINANEHFINDFSTDLISLYRNIATQNSSFFHHINQIDLSWKKAKDFSDTYVEVLIGIYDSFRFESISEGEVKKSIAHFIEVHENELLDILGEYKSLPCKFLMYLNKSLCRKMNFLKNKNISNSKSIRRNIEASVKAALYQNYRSLYNDNHISKVDNPLHSALFLFIRQTARDGMFGYNKKGEFNMSYGGIRENNTDLSSKVREYSSESVKEHFKHAHIYNQDFEDFLRSNNPMENDFIFLDPPYDGTFSTYDAKEFGEKDHQRLANYLLNDCKAKWMMIIKKTDFIYNLYNQEGIYMESYGKAYTCGNTKKGMTTSHLLITNYPVSAQAEYSGMAA